MTSPASLRAAAAQAPSLGALAAARGVRFGSEANAGPKGVGDPALAALLTAQRRILVPGNALKAYVIRADAHPDAYDFAPGDELLAFCAARGLPMRGHNLYWAKDEFTPKWLVNHDFGRRPKLAAETLLRNYIGKVCDHFGDRLVSWDVVNEAIDEKTGRLRDNVMLRTLGPDYLRVCFEAARERLPRIQLVYNDYMSWDAGGGAHRRGALDLLRRFRDANIPVDALGVQGHIGTHQGAGRDIAGDAGAPDIDAWRAFLADAAGLGYGLLVTEFDVNDRLVEGDDAARDAAVAATARAYMDATLACPQVTDFLCWGLDDRHSWLQHTRGRADGRPLRPCPFDARLRPKPLFDAMAAAIPQRKDDSCSRNVTDCTFGRSTTASMIVNFTFGFALATFPPRRQR